MSCAGLVDAPRDPSPPPPPGSAPPPSSLSITTSQIPSGEVQVQYQTTLSAAGGTQPYQWRLTSGNLPPGLTLNTGSGAISGVPSQAGNFSFAIEAKDSSQPSPQSATKNLNLSVAQSAGLKITNSGLPSGRIQSPYMANLVASGGAAPYTWSLLTGRLPLGLALGAASGEISGTPTESGQFNINIEVRDANQQTASKEFTLSVVDGVLDRFGGLVDVPSPNGATGFFRLEKFGNRWLFVTPEGNAYWARGVSLVDPSDLGVDRNGKGYAEYIQEKYAIGLGPDDGFTFWRDRWAYYTRERLGDWGFNLISTFSHPPVTPTYDTDPEGTVPLGNRPSNTMPHVITARAGGNAMRFDNVKNIYGPVFTRFSNPYFPDVFDPSFATSVESQAQTGDWGQSPWVLFVFMDQTDEMRGMDSGHPHLGFIVAATNFNWPQDQRAFGGATTYTDATMYSKFALRDFLQAKYAGNLAALNTAWGTSYTTWDSNGGWGTGTGMLDEDGTHLGTWTSSDPQKEGFPAVRQDLEEFAARIVRKWFQTVYDTYKLQKPNHLLATNNMSIPHSYVIDGLQSEDGTQTFADIIIADDPTGSAYTKLQQPFFSAIPFVTADVDSPLGYAGMVEAVQFDESATDPNKWRVIITASGVDFWWAGNPNYKLIHWVWTQFSSLPQTIVKNGSSATQFYRSGKTEWLAPNKFAVMQSSFFNGSYDDLKAAIQPGDTFKRVAFFHPNGPFATQAERGAAYQQTVTGLFNRQAPNGDYFYVGTNHWSWSDTSWVGYFEAYNFGLVTLRDNAYDGVESTTGFATDPRGFRTGGEERNYGNFLGAVRATHEAILQSLRSLAP